MASALSAPSAPRGRGFGGFGGFGGASKAFWRPSTRLDVLKIPQDIFGDASPSGGGKDDDLASAIEKEFERYAGPLKGGPRIGVEDLDFDALSPPGLRVANAQGDLVMVPETWAKRFAMSPTNSEVPDFDDFHQGKHRSSFTARLASDPKFKVVVESMSVASVHALRELRISQRLSEMEERAPGMVGLAPTLDTWDGDDSALFVLRPLADGSLNQHLGDGEHRAFAKFIAYGNLDQRLGSFYDNLNDVIDTILGPQENRWAPLLPVQESLTLLADLLRGLESLEAASLVHNNICLETVIMADGRAYISDFSTACFSDSNVVEKKLRCGGMRDRNRDFVGSAYIHAPEMRFGSPTGPENDMWAVGLLFAELCLRMPPSFLYGPTREGIDSTFLGREEIRKAIREEFAIEATPGFNELPTEIQWLLKDLLQKDPAKRLRPAEALVKVEKIAKKMDVDLPKVPQRFLRLPAAWHFAP